MESENSDPDFPSLTPPEIKQAAKITSLNLIPEQSRKKYQKAYRTFMDWRISQETASLSENVLLAYFGELSKQFKPSTLWSTYSMLRTTLNINNGVDIAKYSKLRAVLKQQSHGYVGKKSKAFSSEEVHKLLQSAPDKEYLLTKVVLILEVMGACRSQEMHDMQITDVEDLESTFLITLPKTKTRVVRKFTVTGNLYQIVKKYVNLSPQTVSNSSFFLNYQKGKCTIQKVGINKFSSLAKQVANYLNLPDPNNYTGHCFRRTSATIPVDGGADITALKRHGGWKSTTVAEGYIDDSIKNRMDNATKISNAITQMPDVHISSLDANVPVAGPSSTFQVYEKADKVNNNIFLNGNLL